MYDDDRLDYGDEWMAGLECVRVYVSVCVYVQSNGMEMVEKEDDGGMKCIEFPVPGMPHPLTSHHTSRSPSVSRAPVDPWIHP